MTKTKRLRVLREVYARVPSAGCKGLCADQCTIVPVFPAEMERLSEVAGRPLPTTSFSTLTEMSGAVGLGELGKPCPLLVADRCSAYDDRPLICRAYGAVEGIPCPHGCAPDFGLQSDAEHFGLMRIVETL